MTQYEPKTDQQRNRARIEMVLDAHYRELLVAGFGEKAADSLTAQLRASLADSPEVPR
jgi:hypothetical protein